ncbi:MAG: hypothetical protein ACW98Y_06175 [Candidatus Thorarchaeota archaeon]|jgi:hypothetical protein
MTPQKEFFKEPLIRVPVDRIRFPSICPICGDKATKPARIAATPSKNRYLRPEWDPAFHPSVRRRANLKPPETKSLLLHVCAEHYKSDEGDTNYKVVCLAGNGFLAFAFIFALFIIGGDLWIGRALNPLPLSILVIFPLSLLVTIIAFRAGALAASVKIVGFDSGFQSIWFQFKRNDYRDAFMELNAMSAELVSWIMRS